jgi:heme/copper-type cytochrome/quinol oxidase subunit 3
VDVSRLPTLAFGPNSAMWWGTVSFILIEGFTLALCAASYLYLRRNFDDWPPLRTPMPGLVPTSLQLVVMMLSLVPNHLVKKAAHRQDLGATRRWLLVLSAVGIATLVIRWFEIGALNTRWDSHAYGSVVWAVTVAHTLLLVPDVADTVVLCAIMLIKPREKFYPAATDNALYWSFVTLAWVPLAGLVYFYPWMAGR